MKQSSAVHIQALHSAEVILPDSSSKLRLLVINLASAPADGWSIPRIHKASSVSGKLNQTIVTNQEQHQKPDSKQLAEKIDKKDTNLNHIILWFLNFDNSPEEITKMLDLLPTRTAVKGQERLNSGSTNKRLHKFSFWEYEWKIESNEFVGDLADKFIDEIIKPRIRKIKMLADTIEAEFKIVQYYYSGYNPGYHFSVGKMKILCEANLEVDIDTYCLTEE